MSKGRRLVYVPGELVQSLVKASMNEGKSVSKFVEEALRQVLKMNLLGYSPEQARELIEVIHAHKILGGVFVPQDILNYLIENVYKSDKDQLRERWYESGRWHGKYMKEKFEDPLQALKCFLEATRWDLNEIEVKQVENMVKLRCISTVLSTERTELLAKYIEGIMHGLGYKTEKFDCLKGILVSEFKRARPQT